MGGKYFCPCVNCVNGRCQALVVIRSHLICDGFIRSYTNWIWHGELPEVSLPADNEAVPLETGDRMEDMIRDLGQEGFWKLMHPIMKIWKQIPSYRCTWGAQPSLGYLQC